MPRSRMVAGRIPMVAALGAAVLLVSSCSVIGTPQSARSAPVSTPSSAPSTPPSTPAPSSSAAAPSTGPTLVDDTGSQVPANQAAPIVAVYRALEAGDLDGLQRLYAGEDPWADQRTFLSQPANRLKILHALSTHPAATDGYTYPGFVLSGWANDTDRADGRQLHVDPAAMPNPGEQFRDVAYTTTFGAKDQEGTLAWDGVRGPGIGASSGGDSSAGTGNGVATLGRPFAPGQQGYGEVRPGTIFNGGDPTGLVTDVHWESWGGPQATADGTSVDDRGGGTVADAPRARAKVVAFDLGMCQGTLMYRKIEWYFPEDGGQQFDPADAQDICSGP